MNQSHGTLAQSHGKAFSSHTHWAGVFTQQLLFFRLSGLWARPQHCEPGDLDK